MPSPFPGMDPYLESPEYWRQVHTSLIVYIGDVLQPLLSPKYAAQIEEHVYLNTSDRRIIPDVLVSTEQTDYARPRHAPALAFKPDEPQLLEAIEPEIPQRFLEIIEIDSGEVVTVIEVVSPSNKRGRGEREYKQKLRNLRQTETNIVEIDLVPGDQPRRVSPRNGSGRLRYRYFVRVYRFTEPTHQGVYGIRLDERLPRCLVPLLPEDPDIAIDLPAVFTRCYDNRGFRRRINYQLEPDAVLDSAETKYIDQLLKKKGLRE